MMPVAELPRVSDEARARILTAPRTTEQHRAFMTELAAMNAVQTGGRGDLDQLPEDLSIVAWNMERCLYPVESAARLSDVAPHVVLLSEMDHGMARTGQRHTTAEMAQALGMAYAFGVEFFELDLGGPIERALCQDDFNARGWHGNAIMSAVPFDAVTLIRLDDYGHWFTPDYGANPHEPRIGGRMALAAIVPTQCGPICVVSVHLESNAGAAHREAQFDRLMDAIDGFAPDMPVVIGGDLNTGIRLPAGCDWRDETLFGAAEARGYDWSLTAQGTTTRPSTLTPKPDGVYKLDWLGGRGVRPVSQQVLSSLSEEGHPLSDHDAVQAVVQIG